MARMNLEMKLKSLGLKTPQNGFLLKVAAQLEVQRTRRFNGSGNIFFSLSTPPTPLPTPFPPKAFCRWTSQFPEAVWSSD